MKLLLGPSPDDPTKWLEGCLSALACDGIRIVKLMCLAVESVDQSIVSQCGRSSGN